MSASRKKRPSKQSQPTQQPRVIDRIDKLLELVDAVARVDTKMENYCDDTTAELKEMKQKTTEGIAVHGPMLSRIEALERDMKVVNSEDFQRRLATIEQTGTNVVRELISAQTKRTDELISDLTAAKITIEQNKQDMTKVLAEFDKWKWRLGVIAPVLTILITTGVIALLQHLYGPFF